MDNLAQKAIDIVQKSELAFSKFISNNDAGANGAHQAGFYIPKNSIDLIFKTPGERGSNKDRFIKIRWQGTFETDSRFIYYGVGTRNEYRLTRFGKGFPFLKDENVGDLLVLARIDYDFYEAYVLSKDEEIEEFLTYFNLTPPETNQLISKGNKPTSESLLNICFQDFVSKFHSEFPPTFNLAEAARNCYNTSNSISNLKIKSETDRIILAWLKSEYQLFKEIEAKIYVDKINVPFGTVEALIEFANSILNRRKSRAGKSLEHHLSAIFRACEIHFDEQKVSEDNKTPDFLFPGVAEYKDIKFPSEKLILLASKTTCKDRWRQVINEADRIPVKHLFTLQQGISSNQLKEMQIHGVQLVVPLEYLEAFPKEFRPSILTLQSFIQLVRAKQE